MRASTVGGRGRVQSFAVSRRTWRRFLWLLRVLLLLSLSLSVFLILRSLKDQQSVPDLLRSHRLPPTALQDRLGDQAESMPSDLKLTKGSTPDRTKTATVSVGTKTVTPKNVVNPHPFTYLINPRNACVTTLHPTPLAHPHPQDDLVKMLLYVHSAPANFENRLRIRQTWGDRSLLKSYNVTLVFVLGAVPAASVMHQVLNESLLHGDIIQEDFQDSYRNLTYKAVAALRWAANFCSQAAYILKTDDDVVVNIAAVMKFVHTKLGLLYGTRRLIACNVWKYYKPIRYKRSKYYVSREEWNATRWPPFCQGMAYLLSGDMAALLYEASLTTPPLRLDDVYVTGYLVQRLGVKHKGLNWAYSSNLTEFGSQDFFLHGFGSQPDIKSLWDSGDNSSATEGNAVPEIRDAV